MNRPMVHLALVAIALAPVIANWLLGAETLEAEFSDSDVRQLDEAFERILTEYHGG
jgi:hypothetical protein